MADATFTAITAANGRCTVTIRTQPQRSTWVVSQVSIEMPTAPVGTTCSLRKNGYSVSPMIPEEDAATGDPPVTLLPTDLLTVEWVGATPGTAGKAIVFYEEETR